MSATAWRPDLRTRWLECLWGMFVAVNLAAVLILPKQVPIPFHFIWISLALVYGVRPWRLATTLVTMAMVVLLSGGALVGAVLEGHADREEYAEIPLMALLFLTMVFHVRRRQAATHEMNRLAEDRARLLEREHEFLSDASHQLRTPITVARGHAELVAEDCAALAEDNESAGAQLCADAQVVIEELDRLTHLADGLLLLAAAERPEFLNRKPVEVDELVHEVAARWQSVAPRRWSVEATSGAVVSGDRQRLRTALDALVDNAIAFTDTGDEIALRVARVGLDVGLEITDSGPGLTSAMAGRVFERFASDDSFRATGRGTGLGLAGVRAIVVAHGGSVAAGNRPDGGAWFRLCLPASAVALVPVTRDTVDVPDGSASDPRAAGRRIDELDGAATSG